jgi:hypothetical protein
LLLLPLALGVPLGDALVLALGLTLAPRLRLRVRLALRAGVPLAEALPLGLPLAEALALGSGLALGPGLGVRRVEGCRWGPQPMVHAGPLTPGAHATQSGGPARFQGHTQAPVAFRRPYPGQGPGTGTPHADRGSPYRTWVTPGAHAHTPWDRAGSNTQVPEGPQAVCSTHAVTHTRHPTANNTNVATNGPMPHMEWAGTHTNAAHNRGCPNTGTGRGGVGNAPPTLVPACVPSPC